ncbi:MAG: N-acetyltransferase family protein [Actinomycetota bacterium]
MNLRVELVPDVLDDRALLSDLIDIWTDVSNAGGAVGFVPPVTRGQVEEIALHAFAATSSGDHLVVAFDADRPVGFCFLARRPGPLFKHWVTIKRLQIRPELQGKGLGGQVLQEIHTIAVERLDLEQIHLTVRGGTGTEAFYERHGYEIVARIPDVIRVAPDDTREEIYMVKRL